jgi:hypothetical protein
MISLFTIVMVTHAAVWAGGKPPQQVKSYGLRVKTDPLRLSAANHGFTLNSFLLTRY